MHFSNFFAMAIDTQRLPWGYSWRSSQSFIIATATISLFSGTSTIQFD